MLHLSRSLLSEEEFRASLPVLCSSSVGSTLLIERAKDTSEPEKQYFNTRTFLVDCPSNLAYGPPAFRQTDIQRRNAASRWVYFAQAALHIRVEFVWKFRMLPS
jgi:hypothetical protein